MRRGGRGRILFEVAGTHITIRVTERGDSPRGEVSDEDTGMTKPFLGWLALMSVLESLISSEREAPQR